MIITRTPLRISIGGGGTDLPSYYEAFGGFVISAAINKHIYITANKTFRPGYLLKYAKTEHVQTVDEIEHGPSPTFPPAPEWGRREVSPSGSCTRFAPTSGKRCQPRNWPGRPMI
jgi:hypothetical protein